MKVTIIDDKDNIINLEIDENEPVSTLAELIQIEMNIQTDQQSIQFGGKILQHSQIIKDAGIKDDDMIQVSKKLQNFNFGNMFGGQQQQNNNSQQSLNQTLQNVLNQFQGNQAGQNQMGNMFQNQNNLIVQEARRLKQFYQNNPDQLNYLLHQNREFAEAVLDDNEQVLVKLITEKKQKEYQEKLRKQQRLALLQSDPFNVEYQKEIEEMMQQENIENQRELAMEEHPEFFGRISMLYIEIKINKNPIQAFVDSGAESTIMSQKCAERCGLMRLLDKRFAGMALGVGQAKILGRIHLAEMEILDKKLPVNLTILEDDKIEFLLGLDTLKRYQCLMDLGKRQLSFQLNDKLLTIPFLNDGEIKKQFSEAKEKAIQGQQQKPNKEDIDTLMGLGATKEQAIKALEETNGSMELASQIIQQQLN